MSVIVWLYYIKKANSSYSNGVSQVTSDDIDALAEEDPLLYTIKQNNTARKRHGSGTLSTIASDPVFTVLWK